MQDTPTTLNKEDYVRASDIAHSIKRSRPSVVDVILRLKLKPFLNLGGINWYHRDCISPIQAAMRAPNKNSTNHTNHTNQPTKNVRY